MKSKNALCGLSIAVVLHFGVLASSAQTNKYLYSGSETNITLNPGTYIITAYGAAGGGGEFGWGSLGAEMSAEFNFSTSTTLTLLVGEVGGEGVVFCFGGGGGSFVVEGGTPLVIAGGGGGGGEDSDSVGGPGSPIGGNGNVSANGGGGDQGVSANGGTNGGGGGGGGSTGSAAGGGGGGGFIGNGNTSTNGVNSGDGGGSFDNGGGGGGVFFHGGFFGGGFGGGGGAGEVGGGGGGGYSGGGGGNGFGGGGGGGSIIDSSAIAILNEVSDIASPHDLTNGEIIITAVPTPVAITTGAAFGFTNGAFGFDLIGPSGSNVVIQASADLQTWIPLQTNLLGSGPLHISDTNAPANVRRFYRAQLSP
jgi:hypothetical protein